MLVSMPVPPVSVVVSVDAFVANMTRSDRAHYRALKRELAQKDLSELDRKAALECLEEIEEEYREKR